MFNILIAVSANADGTSGVKEAGDATAPGRGVFAQWLYSTSHISIEYGISYDGTDTSARSRPARRGLVLVLLYLALDDDDDRPLIIDQPENLDPQSVYDELVRCFRRPRDV